MTDNKETQELNPEPELEQVIPENSLNVENEADRKIIEDSLKTTESNPAISQEEFTTLQPDILSIDLDELLKIREKNETNDRVRFLLGRTRKELKEYSS